METFKRALGQKHPDTLAPPPVSRSNHSIQRLWVTILKFAICWALDQVKDGQERIESSFEKLRKQAIEHDDRITGEGRLQLAVVMFLEVDDGCCTIGERMVFFFVFYFHSYFMSS